MRVGKMSTLASNELHVPSESPAPLFFLHPDSQVCAGMPQSLPYEYDSITFQVRFRFARAGMTSDYIISALGMLVRIPADDPAVGCRSRRSSTQGLF